MQRGKPTHNRNSPKNMDCRSYTHEHPMRAYRMALLGLTNTEIAETFSVSVSILYKWMDKYPEFRITLNKGKRDADANVAEALYKRAIGYQHKETKVFNGIHGIVTHDVVKHYAPDTTAAIYWLKARTKKNEFDWTDKIDLEVTNKSTIAIGDQAAIDLTDFTDEELGLLSSISLKVNKKK